MLLSGSNSEVKIWNPRSGACLRTIEAGYGLCALFAPGNRHAVVGTKEGNLEVIDVAASSRVQSVPAHTGAVWSLAALPDSRLPHAHVSALLSSTSHILHCLGCCQCLPLITNQGVPCSQVFTTARAKLTLFCVTSESPCCSPIAGASSCICAGKLPRPPIIMPLGQICAIPLVWSLFNMFNL